MSQTTARARTGGAARTLWDEGRQPGRLVVALSTLAAAALAWLNIGLAGRLSLFFDLSFVVLCLVAALAVRPRDFFVVGVMPPLLMLGVVSMLAVVARGTVADEVDSVVQAVVSGLAHHAGGLVAGYATTLGVLALRQVALRSSGRIRGLA
ncbi:MAG TPA: DUF6542 domain-containing protein [Nocardioidaceae bacterium]|nr:DUF6542 domain-containing protein [Nocardioidaceae bacterium]